MWGGESKVPHVSELKKGRCVIPVYLMAKTQLALLFSVVLATAERVIRIH